ncbi:MAG: UPF0146 family protein [Candidatus Hydrothermarchaeota archaeon]
MKGIIDYISENYTKVVEVGLGNYTKIARSLRERGLRVVATDINAVSEDFDVIIDNIIEPDLSIYEGSELIYSIRPPMELVPYIENVAKKVRADMLIRPISGEYCQGELINYKGSYFYLKKFRRSRSL